MIGLVRSVAPASPVLTLEEARAQCRLDATGSPPTHEDDTLLASFVAGATGELEGADGWLGRALVTQTWVLTLPGFPARSWGDGAWSDCDLPLPLPPLQSVTSIVYVDADGVEQTLAAEAYRVLKDGRIGRVEAVYGTAWPATRPQSDAVKVTFVAGYGAAGTDVPEQIRNFIRARIGQLYEHREMVIAGAPIAAVPFMFDSLEGLRIRGVLGALERRCRDGS